MITFLIFRSHCSTLVLVYAILWGTSYTYAKWQIWGVRTPTLFSPKAIDTSPFSTTRCPYDDTPPLEWRSGFKNRTSRPTSDEDRPTPINNLHGTALMPLLMQISSHPCYPGPRTRHLVKAASTARGKSADDVALATTAKIGPVASLDSLSPLNINGNFGGVVYILSPVSCWFWLTFGLQI